MVGFLEKRLLRKSAQSWAKMAAEAASLPAPELRTLRRTAARLRVSLDQFSAASEAALLSDGQTEIQRPDQCDWAWRPDRWCVPRRPAGLAEVSSPHVLSEGVTLFHDCARSEITLRQMRNDYPDIAAGFSTVLDVYRFDGSFLSLVLSLPEAGVCGLNRNHYYTLRARVAWENPIEIYARLNVQHGPNTEQMVRQLDLTRGDGLAEFDLAYGSINEKRVEKAWIDLIFERPAMNQVQIHDLTLTRAPRADM